MSSRFLSLLVLAMSAAVASAGERELRICADPDNLPYSREDQSGFENRIARLVADEMGATLRYEWLPQIRGYVRKTLGANLCDVFVGVPARFERVLPTRPYYRSSYVFVQRSADEPITSFDDERLRHLRIGLQLIGNDLAATPPGHVLAERGITGNVAGFVVMGEHPAAQRIVDAIARNDLDVGLVWGPQAGYFASHASVPLRVNLAKPPKDAPPFEFAIAMGVRRGDRALRDELNGILERRRRDIDAILVQYGVPRVEAP
jgi:mxaJ protein